MLDDMTGWHPDQRAALGKPAVGGHAASGGFIDLS